MTESVDGSTLVPLVDEASTFVERHPFLTVVGAAMGGYILGRFAGDEILNTSMRTISNYIGRQVDSTLTEIIPK